MWQSAAEMHAHRQALCNQLQHNYSPCEQCNTLIVLMMLIPHHRVKEVCMQRDPSPGVLGVLS